MDRAKARQFVEATTNAWVTEDQSVAWAGAHEGRWGIRIAQQVRDFTTIWFEIGERTVGLEAYVSPAPPRGAEEVYRLCLRRNWRSWPVAMALDKRGDIFAIGRIPLSDLTAETLDRAVGAVYELVELSFRKILDLGFRR